MYPRSVRLSGRRRGGTAAPFASQPGPALGAGCNPPPRPPEDGRCPGDISPNRRRKPTTQRVARGEGLGNRHFERLGKKVARAALRGVKRPFGHVSIEGTGTAAVCPADHHALR